MANNDNNHALQGMALVAVPRLAPGNGRSDSTMIIGRNFDFYVNDDFARDKKYSYCGVFTTPHKAINWRQLLGRVYRRVSMNDKGCCNRCGPKAIIQPASSTLVSLVAREVLQVHVPATLREAIYDSKKKNALSPESLLAASGG